MEYHNQQDEQPARRKENGYLDAAQLIRAVAEAAEEKKARGLVILDVQGLSSVTDYFVICHGTSTVQVRAIAEHIRKKLIEQAVRYRHAEGLSEGRWALLDYGDVVVHVFHEHERHFYNLERLWGDAQVVHF